MYDFLVRETIDNEPLINKADKNDIDFQKIFDEEYNESFSLIQHVKNPIIEDPNLFLYEPSDYHDVPISETKFSKEMKTKKYIKDNALDPFKFKLQRGRMRKSRLF